MIEELIKGTAERVPALVLFCFIVYMIVKMFMNHLEKMRARDEVIADRCHASHAEVAKECGRALDRSTDVISENTKVMSKVCDVLDRKNGV